MENGEERMRTSTVDYHFDARVDTLVSALTESKIHRAATCKGEEKREASKKEE